LKPKQFAKIIADPANWNGYAYAHNNPLSKIDPDGFLTIVIPGTWYDETYWRKQGVLERVSKTFGEQAMLWTKNWSGDNSKEARAKGAKELVEFIKNYKFAPGEKLNIVSHSHGGNVAFLVSQSTSHKIDNLVTLGTPIRSDYKPAENNIGQHLNVYSEHDYVQINGGFTSGGFSSRYQMSQPHEGGEAGRTLNDPSVKNLNATGYTDSWSPQAAHSQLWERANLWEKVVVPEIKK
jgi:hypothetical protein